MLHPLGNRIAALCAVASVLTVGQASAQLLFLDAAPRSGLAGKAAGAEIDWSDECCFAVGAGSMPSAAEESNRSKAYLKARNSAKTKAVANLLMAVDGTAVTCGASVRDLTVKDSALRKLVDERTADAQIVSEKQQAQGSATVVVVEVRAPLYGPEGIATAVLKSKPYREASSAKATGLAVDTRGDPKTSTSRAGAKGPFTSLILDCASLDIEQAISPRIRRADGSELWGALPRELDFLDEHGVVAYEPSLDSARRSKRAGGNPLLLKAIGRAGAKFKCDAVVSNPDADLMLRESQASGFLDRFDVIFVTASQP